MFNKNKWLILAWNTIKSSAISTRNFLAFLARRAQNDTIFRVAASLSYTSLIALVPLCAIMISVFSVFPVFETVKEPVKEFLINTLSPTEEKEFSQQLSELINSAGQLTTIGVISLAITSILMLSTIESSLNFIFKVTRQRRITTKITLYWTVITLGPLLLGTAFSMRGYLYTLQKFMPENFLDNTVLLSLLPPFMTMLTLVLVYVLVPNKKVHILSACVGSIIAVIIFSFLRDGFSFVILKSATYKTLYGALATIPVFLIWMYLAWAVVIFGAVLTAALDEFRSLNSVQLKKILISGKPEKRL